MTDIVERLRKLKADEWAAEVIADNPHGAIDMMTECLTEIETLRALVRAFMDATASPEYRIPLQNVRDTATQKGFT